MLQQQIRQSVRIILRNRLFALAVALTLGVGIGANAAIFTVANAILNHPIDFPQPERLISVMERKPKGTGSWSTASPANYLDWRRLSTSFESMAAYAWWDASLTGAGEPMPVKGYRVSPEFFETLGVDAAAGRVFKEVDLEGGNGQLVVLSFGLWQRLFQGSKEILGRRVQLNGTAYDVMGVMPQNFQFPAGGTELWVPLVLDSEDQANRKSHYLSIVAKLKPGSTFEAARTELNAIAANLSREHPETNRGWGVLVRPLTELVVGEIRPFVLLLTGVVALVLLIACVNVASLQLARSSGRELEFATRASFGAPRWRIIQQLLVESVTISLLGGFFAFLTGYIGVSLIQASMPAELAKWLPGWSGVRMDWIVFIFTFAVAALCGVLCGLAPALRLSRTDLSVGMKGRTVSSGRKDRRWRETLIVAEVALAVTLLMGAMATVGAFEKLVDSNRPFDPQHVLTLNLILPDSRYPDIQRARDFFDRLVARLEVQPGVRSAAAVSYMPFSDLNATTFYTVEGEERSITADQHSSNYRSVTPGFFNTLQIAFRQGRDFRASDERESPRVAIVSQKLAAQCWPGQDPLGKRLKTGNATSKESWLTVVGVVADVRHSWLDREIRPTLYVPLAQVPRLRMDVLARVDGSAAALAPDVRRIVSDLDPEQPIKSLRTMDQAIYDVMLGLRFVVALMIVAGSVALLLAIVGIYSVVAYLARERAKEMGIRMALGAAPGEIFSLVIKQGLQLTAAGMVLGLLAGTGLTRLLASVVAGVRVLDFVTLAAVLVVAVVSALIASYLPARSLSRADPMIALRHE